MHLLQTTTPQLYDQMETLYLEAFPKYERKPFSLMQETQVRGQVDMWSIMDGESFVGMAVTMKDKDLVLLDYFAIRSDLRGNGYGSKALQLLYKQYEKQRFFLEIESTQVDCENKAQRESRKAFYLRNGLKEVGISALVFETEMELLAHDCTLNFKEYQEIYEHIYGKNKALMVRPIKSKGTNMLYEDEIHDEERAFYGLKGAVVKNCKIDGPADGESAFKECRDICVENTYFNLRYPFWHVDNATISNCEMTELCRAALWYDNNIRIENCRMHGIKALRECRDITIKDTDIISPEFAWRSHGITVENVTLEGEYPFFECTDMTIDGLKMKGKYSFQYIENVTFRNCVLDTKDAFWHAKNVTVEDSVVKGEYLAWYAENIRFVRCKISGTQPLCYCKGLVLEDCEMESCDLSFERSEVTATVKGHIDSVKNPISGSITADSIGEVILEEEIVTPGACVITTK